MRRFIVICACLLWASASFCQNKAQQAIQEVLQTEEFAGGLVGIKAMTLSGEVIADCNSTVRMLPASNVKLISTGLAIDKFGAGWRFETNLAHSGSIENGTLNGDLYIVGSGDPSLGLYGTLDRCFQTWYDILQNNGIRSINGRVIADHRKLGIFPVNPSWLVEDVRSGDGLELRGLNFRRNVMDLEHLFHPRYIACESPLDTCASAFIDYLAMRGMEVPGPAACDTADSVLPQSELQYLGGYYSDHLADIIRHTNVTSDNFYAEALLHAVLADCNLEEAFASFGIDTGNSCYIVDGCGLSRKDYVSAAFFCDFLVTMAMKVDFRFFLKSLPRPGEGTLEPRLAKASKQTRERIYMKSGSMNGVRCFSGYILPSNKEGEKIVFSILTNNITGNSKIVFEGLDKIIEAIAKEN